jgi:hypothetical protein
MTVTEAPIEPRFRLKLIPILVTAALGYAVPYIAGYGAFYSSKIFNTPSPRGPLLPWLYMQHGLQLLVALIIIAVLKFRLVPADYGLHWPRDKSYVWPKQFRFAPLAASSRTAVLEYLILFAWLGVL